MESAKTIDEVLTNMTRHLKELEGSILDIKKARKEIENAEKQIEELRK